MVEEHRGPSRYDHLLDPVFEDEGEGGWMISYMDVMTLLVALLVLILVASAGRSLPLPAEVIAPLPPAALRLGIPLPEALAARAAYAVSESSATRPGRLAPGAVSAALGVAGRPKRLVTNPASRSLPQVPDEWLIWRAATPPSPRLALTGNGDLAGEWPLRRYLLVLADSLPVNARPVSASPAEALTPEAAPLPIELPDLEGVAVSRVPQGIRLRVEERLLFPSADAALTEAGRRVVDGLVETIQRHAGTVSVEGHSDDRPISTPYYPSNWALSSARAIAIVHALEAAGVASGRLQAVGFADTRPLADNSSEAGRARNRRVEVVIHVAQE